MQKKDVHDGSRRQLTNQSAAANHGFQKQDGYCDPSFELRQFGGNRVAWGTMMVPPTGIEPVSSA